MSDFKTATPPAKLPDPKKRVNYTLGMVLGVDEFQQEQGYFIGKHRLHQRALHGYGTVYGLQVSKKDGGGGAEIVVTPGRAINPLGQDICVTPTQCARLNDWLKANKAQLDFSESESFEQTLYVVLCYRECATDLVPIPGEPCRSQQDSMAASRLADDFELKLALAPPLQIEEEAIREFGALLGRIDLSSEAPAYLSQDDLLALVRQLGAAPGSPPLASPPLSSPPNAGDILYLNSATACEDLRAALRIWVTEVRPKLLPQKNTVAGENDDCVLLARLDFHVNPGLAVDFSSIQINEEERPYLLSTRLLQEWLLCGRMAQLSDRGENLFATLFAPASDTIRAWVHHPALLDIPPLNAVTVEIDDLPVSLQAVTRPLPAANVFDLRLASSPPQPLQHQQCMAAHFDAGLMVEQGNPLVTLAGAISQAGYDYINREEQIISVYGIAHLLSLNNLIDVNVAGAANGRVLTLQNGEWVAAVPGGLGALALDDLSDVNAPSPANGQVLTRQGAQWRAVTLDHGVLQGLTDDDHPQYLRTDGTRALTGNLSAGNNKITNLAAATANGEAVRFEQAIKTGDTASGDLRDTYPNPLVNGLQGRPVNPVLPNPNEVLTWDGAQWLPRPSAASGNFVLAPAGPYAIIAAGYFKTDGAPNGPVYNGLVARPLANPAGDYVLNFTGYRPPDNFMYIVKGTVEDSLQTGRPRVTFKFIAFQQNGIRVRVLGVNNEPTDLGFMVEISVFGKF